MLNSKIKHMQTKKMHSPGKCRLHYFGNLFRCLGIAEHVAQHWAQLWQDVLGNDEEYGPMFIQLACCFDIGRVTIVALRRAPLHRIVVFGAEHPQQADGKVEIWL